MTWTAERIPIVFAPQPGEALDSWLEGYAWRLHTNSRSLLNHLGLHNSSPERMMQTLQPFERRRLAVATGVVSETLDEMTLDRFDGLAATIDRQRRQAQHSPAWRRQRGSRFCPDCLTETAGRWPLLWRLSWSAVCLRHHRLLADRCPRCQRRTWPHRLGNRSDFTPPGTCLLPAQQRGGGTHKPSCGQPLTEASTAEITAHGFIVAGQQHLQQLINTGATDAEQKPVARQQLDEIYLLSLRALTALHTNLDKAPPIVAGIVTECGADDLPPAFVQLGPVNAHTIAIAGALAVLAHTRTDDIGTGLLTWIVHNEQTHTNQQPHVLLRRWRNCGPQLRGRILATFDAKLRPFHRLSHGTAGASPSWPHNARHDAGTSQRAASLPALLWPQWTLRLIPAAASAHNRLTSTRAALAVLTLIPATTLSQAHAAALLGNYITVGSVRNLLARLPPDTVEPLIALLGQLAETLDNHPAPINYTRRRALFRNATVSRRAYGRLATERGWGANTQGGAPHPLQLRILDRHLATILTGAHPNPLPRNGSAAWNPLTIGLPKAVRQFLRDQANRLLKANDISEPIDWQPPLSTPLAAPLPGIEPAAIDHNQFLQALAEHATAWRPLARISEATGLSALHIRLYTQAVDVDIAEHQWAALSHTIRGDLDDAATLHQLYHDWQKPIREIAWMSMHTEGHVKRALTEHGLPTRQQLTTRANIPQEWFEANYLNTGKTVRQAAQEAGCSPTTLRFYANQHAIPFGRSKPPVNPFADWPSQPPPEVVAAVAIPNGIQHLRRVLAIAEHKTQNAAADRLGISPQDLSRSKRKIETAIGIVIFQATWSYVLPTPDGEQFLLQAAKALRGLDRRARGWR